MSDLIIYIDSVEEKELINTVAIGEEKNPNFMNTLLADWELMSSSIMK